MSLSRVIATWFGCGLLPLGPGTWGSLGALLVAYLLPLPAWGYGVLAVLFFPLAVWAAGETERALGVEDPGIVVADEVVGQWLTLAGAVTLAPLAWLFAFVLFRLFDIWKPWPVRRLEGLHGGLGIVADDAMAGVYGALVLQLLGRLHWY